MNSSLSMILTMTQVFVKPAGVNLAGSMTFLKKTPLRFLWNFRLGFGRERP